LAERPVVGETILSYLHGGEEVDIIEVSKRNPELLARCIAYVLGRGYHRERLCRALVCLINYAPSTYRSIAWSLIQEVPLSHLLYITRVIEKNKENSRRLRHALVNKIANSEEGEIIRAYFMATELFRRLFSYMYLPREVINGNKITNKSYTLAYKLSTLSIPEALKELELRPIDLVKAYRIPMHLVMPFIETAEEAIELTRHVSADDFFRHGRWFKNIMGDTEYERIAFTKMKKVRDPLSFISIKEHLEATGALTPRLLEALDKRVEEVLNSLMKQFKLERIALLVDVSGSMDVAVKITSKLYEAFSRMTSITDLIAFRERAFTVELDRLRELEPGGMTSIGSGIVLLAQRIKQRGGAYPHAIILVSDLAENTPPKLNDALKLMEEYGKPPLVVVHCGDRYPLKIDYPHALISVDDFHPRLLMDIMKQIARLTAKIVEEKKITEIVKERKPIEEELGAIELPKRPPETYKPGYLERILCKS